MAQEASFTFTTPLNVNVVQMKDGEHLFVEGDISSNDIDFVNDIMNKNCQDSMQRQVLERNMKLDIEHEAFKGDTHEEKEINKTKIPAGKLVDAVVKALGKNRFSTRVKGEINRHRSDYKNIKGNLIDKFLDAFSVAFLPISIKYQNEKGDEITFEEYKSCDPEKRIRVLDDVLLLNVALTGNPCNTKAQLTEVFMKSMDAVEEYKKLKAVDPSIENNLVIKNKDKKENPLSYVWNKIMSGEVLDKAQLKLVKAAMDVANNSGLQKQLADEIYNKVASGIKLSYKDYYIFRELIEVDRQGMESPVMAEESTYKSHSNHLNGEKQLNTKNSKMTEKNPNEGTETADEGTETGDSEGSESGEGAESGDAEQKTMLKSMSENLKAMAEKYDAIVKENTEIKASLAKITEALEQPIHKSTGVQKTEAEIKAKADAEQKSVDPLSLF